MKAKLYFPGYFKNSLYCATNIGVRKRNLYRGALVISHPSVIANVLKEFISHIS